MNPIWRRCLLTLAAGLLGLCGGCARDSLNRQAVSGTVHFQGAPLDTGMIEFSPLEKQATKVGADVKNGRFAIPAPQGLSPGKYKVLLNAPLYPEGNKPPVGAPGSDLGPAPRELIPEMYNANSTLTATVKAGEKNEFTFDLDPDAQSGR